MKLQPVVIVLGFLVFAAAAQTPAPEAPDRKEPAAASGNSSGGGNHADQRPASDVAQRVSTSEVLSTRVSEIDLRRMPLEDAFTRVAELGGANVIVRWRELQRIGIDPDEVVTFRGRNLTVGQMLWVLFNLVDTADARLGYLAEGDMILISSAEDFGQQMIIRTYDVNDLLARPVEDMAPYFAGGATDSLGNSPSSGGGEVQTISTQTAGLARNPHFRVSTFQGYRPDGGSLAAVNREIWELRMHRLITIITATIEPDSWSVNGGVGSILPFDGRLIVRNSALVHQQLAGSLTVPPTPTGQGGR